MPDQTVPTDTGELTGYAVTAAEFRRIAAALDTLPLEFHSGEKPPYVTMSFLPDVEGDDERARAVVDTISQAIGGTPGREMKSGDTWFHVGRGSSAGVSASVQAVVSGPPDPKDVELERLRAEVAALRSAEDPDHGRTTAVAEAKPDTLMVPHGEVHRTAATVPEQDCGWMTPSGPCHLVPDHPLFPFGPREDSGHISKASADANRARLAELDGGE